MEIKVGSLKSVNPFLSGVGRYKPLGNGAQDENRTHDLRITSALLYH